MSRTIIHFDPIFDKPPPASEAQRADFERLAALPDAGIDTSDILPPGEAFRANATRFRDRALYRPVKRSTTVRPDADVLRWIKAKGKGYQTRRGRDPARGDDAGGGVRGEVAVQSRVPYLYSRRRRCWRCD